MNHATYRSALNGLGILKDQRPQVYNNFIANSFSLDFGPVNLQNGLSVVRKYGFTDILVTEDYRIIFTGPAEAIYRFSPRAAIEKKLNPFMQLATEQQVLAFWKMVSDSIYPDPNIKSLVCISFPKLLLSRLSSLPDLLIQAHGQKTRPAVVFREGGLMLGALRKTPGRTPGQIHVEYYISAEAMQALSRGSGAFCMKSPLGIVYLIKNKDRKPASEDVEIELQGLLDLANEDIEILKDQGINPVYIPACVNEAFATRLVYADKHEEVHAKISHIMSAGRVRGYDINSEKFLFLALTKALRLKDPEKTLSKWAYIAARYGWSKPDNMSYLEESLARIQQIITALGNIERDHNTRYAKWLIKNMNKQNPELLPAARKIRLRFGSVFRMLDWAQRNITGDMVIAYAPAVLPLSGPRTKGKTMLQFVGDGK